jgi:hypothetical protein
MPRALIEVMHLLYDRWRFATPTDFFTLCVVIIAVGWIFTRPILQSSSA